MSGLAARFSALRQQRGIAWLLGRPRLVAFLMFVLLGILSARDVPWTDDARFYVPAAAAYAEWGTDAVVGLASLDFEPLSQRRIDQAFRNNREHPPVAKYVMGTSWLLLHRWTGLLDEVDACRAGILLLWAWMCALVFGLVQRRKGVLAGAFAGLALATMPRVLFHGHVETLDLPVAAFLLATFDQLLRALERPSWRNGILTTLFFALALGSKLNAPFFLVAVVLFLLLERPPRIEGTGLRLPAVPPVVLSMIIVSPLLVWAAWPWMWFDPLARLQQYVQFHTQHYGILFYFRGVLYNEQVAPAYAPALMAALTVPLPVLALALGGTWAPVRAMLLRLPGASRLPLNSPPALGDDGNLAFSTFVVLQAAVQIGAVSLPGVPVYGGIKLFLPAFPFIAVLAGLAFASLLDEIRHLDLHARWRRGLLGGSFVLMLLPGALGVLTYQGAWLSYYNELAGGLRGATASGYERQYYDLAYPALRDALADHLPDGGGIAVLPNPKEYTPYLNRWKQTGELARGIVRAPPERADLLVLTHERRWRGYPEIQARYRGYPLLEQFSVAGVPMLSIYDLRQKPVRSQ